MNGYYFLYLLFSSLLAFCLYVFFLFLHLCFYFVLFLLLSDLVGWEVPIKTFFFRAMKKSLPIRERAKTFIFYAFVML